MGAYVAKTCKMSQSLEASFYETGPDLQQQQQYTDDEDLEVFDLEAVPADILQTVLSFLPARTLLTFRAVCRQWRDVIDRPSLWRDKCDREGILGEYLSYLPEPKDFRRLYMLRPYTRNLLKNPCAKEGLEHWLVISNGGDNFRCETNHPGSDDLCLYAPITEGVPCWATSYSLCKKSQRVNLLAEGCTEPVLDECRPTIQISEWYSARWDCEGRYELQVELMSDDLVVLDRFDFTDNIPDRRMWHQVSHEFKNYPKGVRFVYFTHSGVDSYFWAGHYGPKFTLASVRLKFP